MKKKSHKTVHAGDMILDIVVYIIVAFVIIVSLYPLYLCIVLSFNEGLDGQVGGIYFWPRKPTLENYEQFFSDVKWIKALGLTLARTFLGTSLSVLFTACVAYGLSHRQLVGRKVYMRIIIVAMYFSGGVIPYYAVLRMTGLLDSFLVYIIPALLNLFYTLVAISFFDGIPDELEEAARLDGAKEIKVFTSIILPISKPILATMAIFLAVQHWNSWYDSVFFVRSDNLRTLSYRMMEVIKKADLSTISGESAMMASAVKITPLSVQLAAMTITILPILTVYPFFQRYIISGITLGSVKG